MVTFLNVWQLRLFIHSRFIPDTRTKTVIEAYFQYQTVNMELHFLKTVVCICSEAYMLHVQHFNVLINCYPYNVKTLAVIP